MALKIPDSATLLMHFDENIEDKTRKNTPSMYGTEAYGEGRFKNAIKLNGSNCVKIPYGDNIVLGSGDFTIAGWFYWDGKSTGGEYPRLFSHTYMYSSTYPNSGFWIQINASTRIIGVRLFTSYSAKISIDTVAAPVNEWFHFALIRNGETIYVYLNGVCVGTGSVGTGSIYQNPATSFKIAAGTNEAAANDNPVNYLCGYVDEFIIAKEALWTANFDPYEVPWGTPDRIFQPGIVGKTNVVEGTVIPDTRGQVINYTMLYDGSLGESGEDGANVCFDVNGGYSNYYRNTSYGHTATYNSDNIHLVKSSARDSANSGITTNNPITLDDYSGFLIKVKARHLSSHTSAYNDRPYNSGFVTDKGYVAERLWQIEHKNVTSAEFDGIEFHKKDSTVIGQCYYQIQANGHNGTNLSSSYVYLYAAVLVKEDDYNALCDKAGVSTYATVDALIADTTAISAILSNETAVRFMCKRCTGDFMALFVASSACISLLESSPYKNIVQTNGHWAKFLGMVA